MLGYGLVSYFEGARVFLGICCGTSRLTFEDVLLIDLDDCCSVTGYIFIYIRYIREIEIE